MKESALGSPAEFFILLVALSRLLQWEISRLNVLPARLCGSQVNFTQLRNGGRARGQCGHMCLGPFA